MFSSLFSHIIKQSSRNNSEGHTRYSDKYCAIDKVVFSGPKRSTEINISKKSCFHGDKSFRPIFPCNIEHYKPQVTFYKGP